MSQKIVWERCKEFLASEFQRIEKLVELFQRENPDWNTYAFHFGTEITVSLSLKADSRSRQRKWRIIAGSTICKLNENEIDRGAELIRFLIEGRNLKSWR